MEQQQEFNLFTVNQFVPEVKKTERLVEKDYMHTIEHKIKNELVNYHRTKEEAIKACDLAEIFGITTRKLRDIIATIRSKQYTKIIGDSNVYYEGTKQELKEWFGARMHRTMSSIMTTLDLNPDKIKMLYWLLNKYDKKGVLKGQMQLQFNGWEREFIRQFAEDYGFDEVVKSVVVA